MAYQPKENEIVLNCLAVHGGSIGFSIDKDIAVCLLNKIAQVGNSDIGDKVLRVLQNVVADSQLHEMD